MSTRRDRRIRQYIFRGIIALTVVAFLGFAGWYGYQVVGKQRAMALARELADKKEYTQAALAARRALRFSPSDPNANRLMAEMAEAVGAKEAVAWRKAVAELEPGVSKNYLDWAAAAVRFDEKGSAQEAISKLDAAGKNTAAYHEIAAKLAVISGQTAEVYEHVAAAAQLEPHNENYQLQFAAVQMGSPLPEVRKAATARLEQLTESPKVRREALRILIQAALAEGNPARTMKFTNELMTGPGATFEDRMLYLALLGKMKRAEYWWFLAQLGSDLPVNDNDLVTLLSWMNNNGLARLTLIWTENLPAERSERVPVCVAIAEAHALLGNWGKLKSLLRFQKWGDLEFQREALTARIAREEGDETGARAHWDNAVQLARERRDALSALGRFAVKWNWNEEFTNLLWEIANGRDQPLAALQQLTNKYTAEGKTRDLLRVFTKMLEQEKPPSPVTKNNIAYALLILGMETERAQTLAYEAWNTNHANPEYASTYALALHTKGKSDAGLKILQGLAEKDRKSPTTMLCFAVLSAAQGMKEEAAAFLDGAEKGRLLPEEKALAMQTREKIAR